LESGVAEEGRLAKPGAGRWQSVPFDPANGKAALAQLPQLSAVFALFGADAHAEPYVGRTPNLQSRLARLLQPTEKYPRRLQLAGLVRRIEWQPTGSEFESLLLQFQLLQDQYGTKCLERMHLRAPAFVRYLGGNPYPRITVTHRPSLREADWSYGPFPSRTAAERFSEEMLKLFLLRRCTFELAPDPSYPGCVYSEMKMCLAPCFKGCTDQRYAEESEAVERFLATRGESRLVTLRAERDQASANLEFESAAALHSQIQRVEAVRALAAEIVSPLSRLRAVILQASANPDEVAVFLFDGGCLRGPAAFSTRGMRIQNEQSGSTSLFAQPLAIEAIPEEQGTEKQGTREQGNEGAENQGTANRERGIENEAPGEQKNERADFEITSPERQEASGHDFSRAVGTEKNGGALAPEATAAPAKVSRGVLESRLEATLAELSTPTAAPSATIRQGHLALLKRWYYRPEVKRAGEVFFPDDDNRWPIKAILRGIGRVAAKSLALATHLAPPPNP
jgi:excinuclease UvrABC nuclease subunit